MIRSGNRGRRHWLSSPIRAPLRDGVNYQSCLS